MIKKMLFIVIVGILFMTGLTFTPKLSGAPDDPVTPPYAHAGGPYYGEAGFTISMAGSVTHGVPPFSFSWNFGDGCHASGASTTHAYLTAGMHTATLTVTDKYSSDSDTAQVIITKHWNLEVTVQTNNGLHCQGHTVPFKGIVYNQGSIASPGGSPNAVCKLKVVVWGIESDLDPYPKTTIYSGPLNPISPGNQHPYSCSHIFQEPGSYMVQATVTASNGCATATEDSSSYFFYIPSFPGEDPPAPPGDPPDDDPPDDWFVDPVELP